MCFDKNLRIVLGIQQEALYPKELTEGCNSKHLKASEKHGPDFCDGGQNCPSPLTPCGSSLAPEMDLL